jgi:2-polyprenyl-3-methyl-5-hydroxy-6-metoxy-1,4-benzoquinol methylase
MRQIKECQTVIARACTNPHYVNAYQRAEIWYWYQLARWMYKASRKRSVRSCLDVGAGYGTLALYANRIFKCPVFCTDVTDQYFPLSLTDTQSIYFERNNIEYESLPWDCQFDLILFTEVMEHLNFHPVATLRKLGEQLSHDGRMYVSTPDASRWGRQLRYYFNYEEMPRKGDDVPFIDDHIYHYNRQELLNIFISAGLKVEKLAFSPGIPNRHFNLILSKG